MICWFMYFVLFAFFFFFKQKTAYEMRISDWSSDVCSSDLAELAYTAFLKGLRFRFERLQLRIDIAWFAHHKSPLSDYAAMIEEAQFQRSRVAGADWEIGRAACRERVCQYV